jgi:hypothetical protein
MDQMDVDPKHCWCCHRLIGGRTATYSVPVAVRPASISRNQKPVFPNTFTPEHAFDVGIVISKATRTAIDVTEREAARLCKDWGRRDGEITYDSDDRFISTLVPKRMHAFGVFDTLICARAFARSFGILFADSFRLDLLDEYWGPAGEGGSAAWEDGVEFGGDLEDWPPRDPVPVPVRPLPLIIADRIAPLHHHQSDL